jgi:hypothetical protein
MVLTGLHRFLVSSLSKTPYQLGEPGALRALVAPTGSRAMVVRVKSGVSLHLY